jgi:hypothetical protein
MCLALLLNSQHSLVALGGAIGIMLQAIAGGISLYDRFRPNFREAAATKKRATQLTALIVSAFALSTVVVCAWYFSPVAVVNSAKATPCVPTQTGDAITTSPQSPANTGNGNTTTYGAPAETPKVQPKPKE